MSVGVLFRSIGQEYGEKLEEQGYTLEDLIEADPKDVEEMLRMIHAKPG